MAHRFFRWLLVAVLVINVGLVLNTWVLGWLTEREHPPVGRFVSVDGVRMHLLDNGNSGASGLPLVLIHGASTSLLDMRASLLPALSSDHRVILVDRPGHGYSESPVDVEWASPTRQAQLIRRAVTKLGVKRAVWVGHSWGGSVVLAGLLDEARHVVAGVLLAGASHPWEGGSAWHAEQAARPILGLPFVWQYVEPGGRLGLDAAIAGVFAPEPVPKNYVQLTGVTLSLRPGSFRHNALDLTRLSEFLIDQARRYPTISQPLLLLTGAEDTIVPAWNHSARLMRQIPQSERYDYRGAGHALHHTRSADIARRLEGFVLQKTQKTQ